MLRWTAFSGSSDEAVVAVEVEVEDAVRGGRMRAASDARGGAREKGCARAVEGGGDGGGDVVRMVCERVWGWGRLCGRWW